MSSYNWDKAIAQVSKCNLAGQYDQARAILEENLKLGRPPRRKIPIVVQQMTIAGLIGPAFSLIYPLVQEGTGRPTNPSDEEIIEYAHTLCFLSGSSSSLKELERVKNLSPRGLYVKAVAHNTRWEFSQAAKLYESIIDQKLLSGIDLLKAKHMLAVALSRMGKDFKRVEALLAEIEVEARNSTIDIHGFTRAVLRDRAICALEEGRPAQALELFEQLYRQFPNEAPITRAIMQAHIALAELMLDRYLSPRAIEKVHRAKDKMLALSPTSRAWLRRITMIEALIRKDRATLVRLYYTSPYDSLKERMLLALGEERIPATYDLYLGPAPKEGAPRLTLNLLTGAINDGKRTLKTGNVVQRLLWTMGRDPYTYFRFWDLFQEIFPNERVSHVSAKGRLGQAVQRFRVWLKRHKLPIELVIDGGFYSLSVTEACSFIITDDYASIKLQHPSFDDFVVNVKQAFGSRSFSTAEVIKQLGLARRSAIRRLDEVVKAGLVERTGTGPSTRYRLKHSESKVGHSSESA